jgi:small ligand-binding sensory domain FIST
MYYINILLGYFGAKTGIKDIVTQMTPARERLGKHYIKAGIIIVKQRFTKQQSQYCWRHIHGNDCSKHVYSGYKKQNPSRR